MGHRRPRRAFTLVELLVSIGIIALLLAILVPALSRARMASRRTQCLSNIRGLCIAQTMYAAELKNQLVNAGDGSFDQQGSWIGRLAPYSGGTLARRCPDDQSPFFDSPDLTSGSPVLRTTSYGINNYVSPTHAPAGLDPIRLISQVRRSSTVIQFVELSEEGSYAVGDHVHAQLFYSGVLPGLTLTKINAQMPAGRHGGVRKQWSGLLNYGFLDGHAETLPLDAVYTDPTRNRFDPAAAP